MKRLLWIAMLLAATLAVAGCGNMTPMAKVTAARADATAAIKVVTTLYMDGRITDEQAVHAYNLAKATQAVLDQAEAAIRLGQDVDVKYFIELALAGVRELVAMQIQAERAGLVKPAAKPTTKPAAKGTSV